ncbi:MAG: [ribosomal protein S18]-alanine N-acetyltransferase [Actinomycetota bacterium]|jgi:ribosomal-protein-alanine N-acetyltransferase|nr:[ribosomal protein S18]-alanine N-acetyltransferase [Actinomycetota bacterium]
MTTLRAMRWWDLEAAVALERGLFADPWSPETFWSELAGVPDTRHYLVAEDGGAVVGYAGLFATRHQADVQTIAVASAQQGSGLGGVLLEALIAEASRRGCAEVLLEVRVDNMAARRLYERFGFEQISVRRGYYQPGGVDGLVMRLRL